MCTACMTLIAIVLVRLSVRTSVLVLHVYHLGCREYATDVNVLVARMAIQAVGKIALRVSARANTCADKLVSLLAMEIDYVTAETLVSLASEFVEWSLLNFSLHSLLL